MQVLETEQKTISVSEKASYEKWLWYVLPVVLLTGCLVALYLNGKMNVSLEAIKSGFSSELGFYILVGLGAQLVDGTLGMAYGATSTSFLLSLGVPPAVSSTSVHVAEMFTTGASAISHFKFKNINKKLFKNLLIPGVLGSITGAYLLSDWINGDIIKPYISAYMVILGIIIIRKGLQKRVEKKRTKRLGVLAVFGGFMDAVGGGGWGPIVTSSLLGRGRDPRYTIGSVNAAEFAVSFSSGVTFLIFEGVNSWQVVLGLIIGGVIASPFGAILVNRVKRKPMMVLVGVLVVLISLRTILKSFHLL